MNKKKNQIQYAENPLGSIATINQANGVVSEERVKKIEHKRIDEGGLSRLYSHIKDNNTFAVIGSQDKDTGEDRSQELYDFVHFGRIEIKDKKTGKVIKTIPIKLQGFNWLKGTYTYEDSSKEAVENSLIAYNISKEDALKLGKALNQETILWKDPEFFGYIYVKNGEVPEWNKGGFKGSMSFDKDKIKDIGGSSTLVGRGWSLPRNRKSKNKPFVYECFLLEPALRTGYVSEYLIDSYFNGGSSGNDLKESYGMTKDQQEFIYKKSEEIRKAVPFNIIKTTKYQSNPDGNAYCVHSHLYGDANLSEYQNAIKYLERAKQFFINELEDEDEYLDKLNSISLKENLNEEDTKPKKVNISNITLSSLKKIAQTSTRATPQEAREFNYATNVDPIADILAETDKAYLLTISYYRWNKDKTGKDKRFITLWYPKRTNREGNFYKRVRENNGANPKIKSRGIRESLSGSEYFTKEEIKTLPREIEDYLQEQPIPKYYDISVEDMGDKQYVLRGNIDYGDISHDHRYFDNKVKEFFDGKGISVDIYEPDDLRGNDDGDGIYSSAHIIQKSGNRVYVPQDNELDNFID